MLKKGLSLLLPILKFPYGSVDAKSPPDRPGIWGFTGFLLKAPLGQRGPRRGGRLARHLYFPPWQRRVNARVSGKVFAKGSLFGRISKPVILREWSNRKEIGGTGVSPVQISRGSPNIPSMMTKCHLLAPVAGKCSASRLSRWRAASGVNKKPPLKKGVWGDLSGGSYPQT